MGSEWQVAEGNSTEWIAIPGFGEINARRDDEAGGRQYFNATVSDGGHARVAGDTVSGGPEVWHFEFDQPFWLADRNDDHCLEVTISLLEGGRYAIKYRPGHWPTKSAGGWS